MDKQGQPLLKEGSETEREEKTRCGDKDNQLFCSEPVEWYDSKVFIEQYEKEHFR